MKYKPKDRVVYKNKVYVVTEGYDDLEGSLFRDLPVYSIATPDSSEHAVDVPEYKLKPLFLNVVGSV